jgi:predicted kinase
VTDPRPLVIAVGGAPGAGKSTLARRLGEVIHVPVLVRDELKEGMHVTARSDDPAEVHRFAEAAYSALWATARDLVRAGVSLIVEAAFHRDRCGDEFATIATRADLVLLWCRADPDVARARYRARAPLRHPAHADTLMAERMDHPTFDWSVYDPPPGSWTLIPVDTGGAAPVPAVAELAALVLAERTGSAEVRA